jgi:TonB-linked SusC/RagA family outer membrane protein
MSKNLKNFNPIEGKSHMLTTNFVARMAITLLLFIMSGQFLNATPVKGQSVKEVLISLELNNASLITAFEKIEVHSPFIFMYNLEEVDHIKNLNIFSTEGSVERFLEIILRNTSLTYRQIGNRILIKGTEQQEITVQGQVSDNNGLPLPGVNVFLKGTTKGVMTDFDGNYTLTVPRDGVLVTSYIGYVTQEVPINNRTTINIFLNEDVQSLNEVVVTTSLGINRQKRSLTYATQEVSTEELSEARELNVISSLSGKVPGLNITSSGTGVGAANRVILRGNRSISGDSQPLYVVDGVPIIGDPSDLSPDNIASLNVLKGPNAAALYGSAAQNGVIIIETKIGKAGVTNITLNTTTQMLDPLIDLPFQNEYGQGISGIYNPNSDASWGPRMTGQLVDTWSLLPEHAGMQYNLNPQPNNIEDAFQTGFNTATNIAANMGSEKVQGMFTYTRTDAKGIVPGNELVRNSFAVRVTSQLTDKLKLDSKIDFTQQEINDPLVESISNFNPIKQIYMMPRNIRTEDAEQYTYLNDGIVRQNYWTPGSTLGLNPYFLINRASNALNRERTMGMLSLTYDFTKDLMFMVRGAYDNISNGMEERLSHDFYARALNGRYTVSKGNSSLFNGDFLMSYNKDINTDWNISANLGGSIRNEQNSSITSSTGVAMVVPDFWTLSNTLDGITSNNPGPNTEVQSLYGFSTISWKNAVFLDFTGRNDWSSTLPAENRSYFYPSVGISTVLSDLFSVPEIINFAKVRASWAKVGSGGPAYMLNRTANFSAGGNNGFLFLNSVLPNPNLLPEETNSYEVGLDMGFFDDRLSFNITGYKTNTLNQLFTVALPPGSGASHYFTNGGNVENKGIEVLLSITPVKSSDFRWDSNVTYSLNRNKVIELNDERPKLIVGSDQSFRDFVVIEGQPFGQIFSIGWDRDENGNVIVGENGVPLNSGTRNLAVANANPDWTGGISNTISYKNLEFSFLIDHRQGGTVLSVTDAMLKFAGLTEQTLLGREDGLVFGENLFPEESAVNVDGTPNDNEVDAQTFWRATGGVVNPVGEAFVESMTNTRLREVTLGYTFDRSQLGNLPMTGVKFSLVGRNLLFLYKESETIDPDIVAGTSVISEGQSSFTPPTTRSYGFNLKINF